MSLLDRVKTLPAICGIEFAFTGELLPSTIEGYQQFTNSIVSNADFQNTYFGRATVDFDEQSETKGAGPYWTQKLKITFPASDSQRGTRLDLMQKIKFAKILLSNGKHIVIGRNDFHQNSRMRIKVKADHRLGQVELESKSIFASGYTPAFSGGLPTLFPIDFIND